MLVELDGIWARQMAALALGGHSSMDMEASETPPSVGVLRETKWRAHPGSAPAGAAWSNLLPPTFGGLVGLRPSEAPEGGLWPRQQQHAAQDCMI